MRHVVAILAAAAVYPAAAQSTRTLIPVLDPPRIATACEEGIARARAAVAKMEARDDGATFFEEWNHAQIVVDDVIGPISVLGSLHPDKAVRDAVEPCLRNYTALSTEIYQNEKLYARVKAARASSPREEKLKKNLAEGFEDSGVALPAEKRARAKEIFTRLETLRQDFERNVRDDKTTVTFTAVEMVGTPEAFAKRQKRDDQGNYVLVVDDPTYTSFMSSAASEDSRKRMYLARFNKGGAQNIALLGESFQLRKELANLYGFPTYGDYALRRKMVGTPQVVNKFLADVKRSTAALERDEIADFTAAKVKDTGAADAKVRRWDTSYYLEKVRKERFAIDQEKLRKNFPTDKAVAYAMLVAETLYGIKFREAKVETWHPDVRYFDVLDSNGRFMASVYLDLFPREGKRGGAWASGARRVSRVAGRLPLSVLATNFNREGLTQREMETLMHEFGHVLHGILSTTDYVTQAGTSVKRDFVEAPSQMFEEWVRREQPLALFRKVCEECPRLSREEIERLESARRYGNGLFYSGQWLLASFDMALSTDPRPPMEVWKSLESATALGYVEETLRPASFAHIAGSGYAAGYYGYMWSEVIALDMLSPFKKDMLDAKVGARYRDLVLAQGGQDEEMNLVRKFLGREPSSDAFFAEIAGKR
jgi:thimet oligopeptidase